ncbi:MAG: hypothetical protein J6M46_10425 [Lachnospiraceae bacterium]|nr:hypothetical protein [Lachnospiraceae bacterium]
MSLRLPRLISDGMVLERDREAHLWGWTEPGTTVQVLLDGLIAAQCTAKASGRFDCKLPKQPADHISKCGERFSAKDGVSQAVSETGAAGHTLQFIVGDEENVCEQITVQNVAFGHVYFCTGQSNMELPMARVKDRYPEEMHALNPAIRTFKIKEQTAYSGPLEDVQTGSWISVSPQSIADFSATAYFFGKKMAETLQEPVGLINATLGGSLISSWMSREMLEGYDELLELADRYADPDYYAGQVHKNEQNAAAWNDALEAADAGRTAHWEQGLPEMPACVSSNTAENDVDKTAQLADGTDAGKAVQQVDGLNAGTLILPAMFTDTELAGFTGSIWFEKRFTLTAEQACRTYKLWLGTIVDRDETYVNGVAVGRTDYQYPPRKYAVPAQVLHAGENCVTIRVVVENGAGRFTPDKHYCLFAADCVTPEEDPARIRLDGEWIFRTGARMQPCPQTDFVNWKPTGLYNAMTAPCHDYVIEGVLWYQGESNTHEPQDYVDLTRRQIEGYRKAWKDPELPYFFVQLPRFVIDLANDPWYPFREKQRRCLAIPGTGMAVAYDLGEDNDLHPHAKKEVGERLARLALARCCGVPVECAGPEPVNISAQASRGVEKIRIRLGHADGLQLKEEPQRPDVCCVNSSEGQQGTGKLFYEKKQGIRDFEVLDENGTRKVIRSVCLLPEKQEIELSCDTACPAAQVRWCYGNTNQGQLIVNDAGLPMGPFVLPVKQPHWEPLWLRDAAEEEKPAQALLSAETLETAPRAKLFAGYTLQGFSGQNPIVRSAVKELERGTGARRMKMEAQEAPAGECGLQILRDDSLPAESYRFELMRKEAPEGGQRLALATADENGLLYGVFDLLRTLRLGLPLDKLCRLHEPAFPLRMLNHWDNMNGTIERGYSGSSFFFEDGEVIVNERTRDYARLCASIGINAVVINNVNVTREAARLITDRHFDALRELADILESWGIRLYLSVSFAAPIVLGGLDCADPLDEQVQNWWSGCIANIYRHLPNLGGFLVKADSEGQPGPYAYGRTQADGANLLADRIRPYGGRILWRCFVYNCTQDWRDTKTDRARAGYDNFVELDGAFHDNVILQIKNGPMDFQIREPVSPLFGGLQRTNQMLEMQIAQEYTGHQIDLCYLIPMFKEILSFRTYCRTGEESKAEAGAECGTRTAEGGTMDTVADIVSGRTFGNRAARVCGITAVSNTGNDACWTGNDLAAANWYGFGRLAFEKDITAEEIAAEWIGLTFSLSAGHAQRLLTMLMHSRETYEKYTSPLGIGWMVTPATHYGPSVNGYEYDRWGTYHRADHLGIGVDRTDQGTGYALQYNEPNASMYNDPETCPEELLLFFHHMPYSWKLKSGKTILQHIYDTHYEGLQEVEKMLGILETMEDELPAAAYQRMHERMVLQLKNAREWCDQVNSFFFRMSGIPDEQGRPML